MKIYADAPTELKELPPEERIINNPLTAAFIIIAAEALVAVIIYLVL